MRCSRFVLAVALAGSGCAAALQDETADVPRDELALHGRQSNLSGGVRSFDDEAFGKLDDQAAFALEYAQPIGVQPLRLEGGLHFTLDTASDAQAGGAGVELESQTFELSGGLNAAALLGRWRPYVGCGLSALYVQMRGLDARTDELFRDEDVTLGAYVKGGLLYQASRSAHVGLEYRRLAAGAVSLDEHDVDADYGQLALVVGASF